MQASIRASYIWTALAALAVCGALATLVVAEEEAAVEKAAIENATVKDLIGTTTAPQLVESLGTETPVTKAPATQKFQGEGRQASNKFKLEQGLAFFRTAHNGTSNFVVYLVNDQGEQVQSLYNEIGTFEANRGFEIKKAGEYLFDVQADGKWAFVVDQPRPTTGDAMPKSLTGKRTDVSPFLSLKKGLSVFKFSYKGDGRFSVTLSDQNGRPVEHIINRLRSFDGSAPVKVPADGLYFLNVNADGNWQIDVQ